MAQMEELDRSCGYASYREKYLTYPPSGVQPQTSFNYSDPGDLACDIFDIMSNAAYQINPCWNVYEITSTCPLLSDPLGFPTGLTYTYPGLPVYFDRADVKRAIHAPENITWAECSGPVFVDDDDNSVDSIQHVLPQVIEATNRVLVANGDLDMIVLTNGTLLSIQNMTWNGKMGFQEEPSKPIIITLPDLQYEATFADNGFAGGDDPQGTMGVQHYERGLMFARTYLSGHMEPQFQPRSSYRHLQWLLGHIEAL
jgi:carboxypeptidase D